MAALVNVAIEERDDGRVTATLTVSSNGRVDELRDLMLSCARLMRESIEGAPDFAVDDVSPV